MTKDMRPNAQGIVTTNGGKIAGAAHVMRRGDLNMIPNMTDDQLAELQFVAFDLHQDHYMLKVASAVRRHIEVQGEHDPRPVMDLFFVNAHWEQWNSWSVGSGGHGCPGGIPSMGA